MKWPQQFKLYRKEQSFRVISRKKNSRKKFVATSKSISSYLQHFQQIYDITKEAIFCLLGPSNVENLASIEQFLGPFCRRQTNLQIHRNN